MRVIEQKIVDTMKDLRFKDSDKRLSKRDYVWSIDGEVNYRLHHTNVIRWKPNGDFVIWTGGWETPTTKSRINNVLHGIGCNMHLFQDKFIWYWSGGIEFDDGDVLHRHGTQWEVRGADGKKEVT